MQKQQLQCKQNEGRGFDVILLDLDMPIMNGFEACQRMREGPGS